MKMTPEHLATLRQAVSAIDTTGRRETYRSGAFPRSASVRNLDTRYRWDLLWAVYDVNDHDAPLTRVMRAEYTTAHIDTALRACVPPVTSGV